MRDDILKELYRHDDGLPNSMWRTMERDELELPMDTMGVLYDIFRCGQDRPAYSRRLGSAGEEGAQIGNGGGEPKINTWPFGVPCNTLFPEFVAVCAGQRKMEEALDRTLEQCEMMSRNLGPDLPKTVTILTDKWHDPKFRKKYDLPLLRYALKHNILITFWLVTDYGVTRIPFLARNRADLKALRFRKVSVEIDPRAARASLLDGNPCTYSFNAGTWRIWDNWHYEFDFAKRICLCWEKNWNPLVPQPGTRKRIPADVMERFAQAVQPILELPGDNYSDDRPILDAGSNEAHIFGKQFRWKIDGGSPCFDILSEAFRELIDGLK